MTFRDSTDSPLNTADLCPAYFCYGLDVIMLFCLLIYCVLCVVYFDEVKDVYGIVDSRKFGMLLKFRSNVLLVVLVLVYSGLDVSRCQRSI